MQKILALIVLLSIAFLAASARLVPLLNDNSATKISGEYIVVLRPGMSADDVNQHIQDLQGDFALSSGVNHLIYTPFNIGSFKGFSAKLSLDMLGRERAHPDVSYIEANQEVRALDNDKCATQKSVLWNLDRISEVQLDLDGEYHYEGTGQGVNAYIVDTGIQIDNVDFEGRASWGFKVDNQEVDGNGHGTHVASTVGGKAYGVAKKVTLIAVKVLGTNGSGTTAGVISGINFVTDQHSKGTRPSVANMSLGGGRSASLVSAVENSVAAGVIYAVAAGNDNANACNYSPADAPNAITVGATTSQDYRSTFSNWGACVDIFAPGTTITAAWIGAKNAIKTISGTSMASPHVAGAVAILLGKDPNLTPEQVANLLTDSCTTNALKDVKGSPNCLLFSGCDN